MYEGITFPTLPNRPFFYTNFVSTADGKIQVLENTNDYWPIGSKLDHDTLVELRSYADAMIHGKNTVYGIKTLNNIEDETFRKKRKELGKEEYLPYIVVSGHPDDSLIENLKDTTGPLPVLVTTDHAAVSDALAKVVEVVRLGKDHVNLNLLAEYLHTKGYKSVLMEGGSQLLGTFFKAQLIDEVFLTIAPKIFGNEKGKTITMVEGHLFPANYIPSLTLLSVKQEQNELYLRYKVTY